MTFQTDNTEEAVAAGANILPAPADTANTGFCLDYQEKWALMLGNQPVYLGKELCVQFKLKYFNFLLGGEWTFWLARISLWDII